MCRLFGVFKQSKDHRAASGHASQKGALLIKSLFDKGNGRAKRRCGRLEHIAAQCTQSRAVMGRKGPDKSIGLWALCRRVCIITTVNQPGGQALFRLNQDK